MDRGHQMDLFDTLPGRPDDRAGWIQIDLFVAAAEAARERRLKSVARPRLSRRPPRQAPLIAVVKVIPCGIGNCQRSFTNAGIRIAHLQDAHPKKPSEVKPSPRSAPAPNIVAESEQDIRARIRAALGGGKAAGDDRREGEVA